MIAKMADVRLAAGLVLCFCVSTIAIFPPGCKPSGTRSFVVDYGKHTLVKDGCPFFYVSGSIHYTRVPPSYWRDRLRKMAAAGLDAIQVYVPWNAHEARPGQYDFSHQHDIVGFLQMAQQEGLGVILRAGPYICAEWDFGGLPAWLLQKNGSVVVRTMDPGYIAPVDRWLSVLLPKIKPLLYSAGGPVLMVQVENEYGSYFACDHGYLDHLQKQFRAHLGDDVVLFTTDGNALSFLKCGTHPDLFTTVDFGPTSNVSKAFDDLRKFQPDGPLVNSEFYTGWLDYWGHPHAHGSTDSIVKSLKQMLAMKASVNMYMFEGGTNFGFTNGADPPFNICPTSYDYDSPMTEAGDTTDKYLAIRDAIMQYKKVTLPVPANITKAAYGTVTMKRLGGVLDLGDDVITGTVTSQYPRTMEQLGQGEGFILYSTTLTKDYAGDTLVGSSVRDRAHVFLDGNLRGLIDRNVQTSLALTAARGQVLSFFVENQGHISFGTQINNGSKGIYGNVTLGGDTLLNWTTFIVNMTRLAERESIKPRKFRKPQMSTTQGVEGPAVYTGSFRTTKTPADTFLNVTGWFKGQAFVNGFNLGRYWPVRGPQVTLYVPAGVLKPYPAYNSLILLELDRAPCSISRPRDLRSSYNDVIKSRDGRVILEGDCVVSLVENPLINGPYQPFRTSPSSRFSDWRQGRSRQ